MRPLPLSVLACTAVVGCGTGLGTVSRQSPASAADVKADTLVQVAQRIYSQEVTGVIGRAQVRRIARDTALTRALAARRPAALRAAALRQLFLKGKHVVRIEVLQNGAVRTDVGGRFVVGGESGVLRAPNGRRIGELELSMQDVLGYRKLVNRLTGAQVVIRGNAGHVETSLPAAAQASLPGSGTVSLQGRTYVVREFGETGFAGEPLRVWLLVPDA
jgi:hypothetical protein